MKKEVLINILIITVIVVGVVFFILKGQKKIPQISPSAPFVIKEKIKQNETSDKIKTYTLEEISQHNNEKDCWLIIDDRVYQVENYIDQHPGGRDKIINNCGKDASQLFKSIKNGQGHSTKAWRILENYYIGLVQK